MRNRFCLFAAGLLACGVLFTTAYGQSQDVRPDGRGDRIRGTPPKASTGAVVTGNGINYHGGPVLHTINVYYIWYGNWNGLDPTGPPILTDFASNDGGSPYFDINTTYADTAGSVPNAVTFAGQTMVAGNSTSLSHNDVANINQNLPELVLIEGIQQVAMKRDESLSPSLLTFHSYFVAIHHH